MYLMVGGGILFTFEVLVVLAHLTPCDADDKMVLGLFPIVTLTMFAVTIWGSVVVFGKLNHRGLKLDGAIGDFAEPL